MPLEEYAGGFPELISLFLAGLLKRWRRYARRRQARKSRWERRLSKQYRRRFRAQAQ